MFFRKDETVKILIAEVADLKEQVSRLKTEQDAHWKVLNSILDRIKKTPHGVNKDGTPRKKPGRKAKVTT